MPLHDSTGTTDLLGPANYASQFATVDQRLADQLAHLQRQLAWTLAHSPFYGQKIPDAAPDSGTLELTALPFTEKDELRRAQESESGLGPLTCVDRSSLSRICSTSGTTGRPLYYTVTPRDKTCIYLGWGSLYSAAGFTRADLAVFAFALGGPYGSAFGGEALELAGIPGLPVGAGAPFERFRILIEDLRPTALVALTTFPTRLAQKFREVGMDPADLGIRKLMVGGEPAAAFRQTIEADFDAEAYEVMGMGEFGMVWGECSERRGMHDLNPAFTFVEYLDPASEASTLEPVKGQTYELVYTSLNREAMPILRYRSHDLVVVLDTTCPCGRTTPLIRAIGRSDDMVKVRGMNIFPAGIEQLLAGFGSPVRTEFQIVLPPDGARKYSTPLELVVACEAPEPERHALSERLGTYLRSHTNVATNVVLVDQSELIDAVRGGLGRRDYFRIRQT